MSDEGDPMNHSFVYPLWLSPSRPECTGQVVTNMLFTKNKGSSNAKPIAIDGVRYESVSEAQRKLKLSISTVYKRAGMKRPR